MAENTMRLSLKRTMPLAAESIVHGIPSEVPPTADTSARRTQAKDSWFIDGYLEGNDLWPQRSFGADLSLAYQLYRDPPQDWQDLLHLEVTPHQRLEQKRAMAKAHRGRGIKRVGLGHARKGEKIIPTTRLQELFDQAVVNAGSILIRFASNDLAVSDVTPEGLEKVNSLFHDPALEDKRKELGELLTFTNHLLTQPDEGMQLAATYKSNIVHAVHNLPLLSHDQLLADGGRISRFLDRYFPDDNENRPGKFLITRFPDQAMKKVIAHAVAARFGGTPQERFRLLGFHHE